MRKISSTVKSKILVDPFYDTCSRWEDGHCDGRITWEHAFIYAGRQIDEVWAIIPLCEYHHSIGIHHGTGDLQKKKNHWISLNRATNEELQKYPRADFIKMRHDLNKLYGTYNITLW